MKSDALAVVVMRLQVPELHAGHRYLLNSVTAIHENVLVVIGETEARLTAEDPLTFEMRSQMLLKLYPQVKIERLGDHPSDAIWSQTLDVLINRVLGAVNPSSEPTLYGGRDSFLKHYLGSCRTFELPPIPIEPSGTAERAAVEVKHTPDFRAGMIYASKHKFPISYQCVDVAIMQHGMVLLGQKKIDDGKYRFIGGFVSPQDVSLEAAARREVREETGMEPGGAVYLGSARVNDYRYRGSSDSLLSAFFIIDPMYGAPVAADDVDAVRWFSLEQADKVIIPEHVTFLQMLTDHFYSGGGVE